MSRIIGRGRYATGVYPIPRAIPAIDSGIVVGPTLTGVSNTLALDQANTLFGIDHAAETELTVPPNSAVPFVIGTTVVIYQFGIGELSLVEGAGVTILRPAGLVFPGQYIPVTIIKVDTDVWLVAGPLT